MGLFNYSQKSKRVAIFHIGSASVHAGFVELRPDKKNIIPEIIFSTITEMPITTELDFSSFQTMMSTALTNAAHSLQGAHLGAPDEILCFLGSPWYAAQVRTVRLEKNTPFTVTQKLVDDLVKKEIDSFAKEELVKYEEAGNEAQIIEREITRITLNGYPVVEAYDQKTTSIEFSLTVSMSPAMVIDKVVNCINTSYYNKKVRFHSFMYAGTLATRDLFISKDNFIFIDIGGEITDTALVKNGVVSDMVSFPIGKNVLLRRFALDMGKHIPDAEPLLALYRDKKLETSLQIKAEKVINTIMQEWITSFKSTLSHLATEFLLPDTIALTTMPDVQVFFTDAINSEQFGQFTLTEKPFTVIPITNQSLAPFIKDQSEKLGSSFIAIEAIVAARKNI